MKYLKEFETEIERRMCTDSQEYVSFSGETNKVHVHQYDYAEDYLTFIIKSPGTIVYTANTEYPDATYDNSLSYSKNGGEWTAKQNNITIQVAEGDIIKFKGNCGNGYDPHYDANGVGRFSGSTASFDIAGNIVSLLFGDEFFHNKTALGLFVFRWLFAETNVINARKLCVIKNIGPNTQNPYVDMFYNCRLLESGPKLKQIINITNNVYAYMLNSTNVLPDVSDFDFSLLYCLSGLFAGTKVTDDYLRSILPINPQTNNYYLPATVLTNGCYMSMFQNCELLTTAPELPATTLSNNCYYSMFFGCTSLTTVPVLPATTLMPFCYFNMFQRCTNLSYIKMLATNISATSCLTNWVNGVSTTGTFIKNASMTTLPSGNNGIPEGWTVQDA